MWSLFLLAAVACPSMHLVSSSAGLAGVVGQQITPLTPETLDAWLSKRSPQCPPLKVWAEEGMAVPVLPRALAVEVKRFAPEDASIIREGGYDQLPESVRQMYRRSAMQPPVYFAAVEVEQPTIRMWTGEPFTLFAMPQVDVTPPYATVRSSKINYQDQGFAVTWVKQKAWLALGSWPLPIRFVDDGRSKVESGPALNPMEPLLPGDQSGNDMIPLPPLKVPKVKRCTALALVSDQRGLTAIDGPKATPLTGPAAAARWLEGLRASGCQLPLTWWHAEGTPQPKPDGVPGKITFATFAPGLATFWGEQELRALPGPLLEESNVFPPDMVVKVKVKVPMLSACGDPPGPEWKPAPPAMARLELQALQVELPFAVLDPRRLQWSGLSGTSGRCSPRWVEREVLLRVPPTALPIRLAQ